VIVPDTVNEPFDVNVVLPMAVMDEPAAMEKADAAPTKPPVIVHADAVIEIVLFAKTEEDDPSAKALPPEKTPSETNTAKLPGSVSDPPASVRRHSRIVDALLPSVLAVDDTTTVVDEKVALVTAPSAPFHVSGTVKVVTGGTHRVEPAPIVTDAISDMSSGAVALEQSSGSAPSIV